MSKIEKALNRAKGEAKMALVPTSRSTATRSKADSRQERSDTGRSTSVTVRASSTAEIARMQETSLLARTDLEKFGIIYPDLNDNYTVQSFREIRTRILQRTQGRNAIVMITSVSGGSGNSFVALNLAVAFAFDAGRTALLMDCNLGNSSTQRLFGDEDPAGITDYLENPDIEVRDILHPVGIERLRVIPAGRQKDVPTEYFTSQKAHQLLDGIRDRYSERFVIVDAPPMSESADTQILSELCDFVLLVAPYGKVTTMQIDACIDTIDPNKFLGVVFNDEPRPIGLNLRDTLSGAQSALLAALRDAGDRLGKMARSFRHARIKK